MRLLFFLSGAASLIYQVLWTRQLALVFGNTIQAASTTVACFLLGLGLGAYLGGRIGPSRKNLMRDFALAELCVAVCGFIITRLIPTVGPLAVGHTWARLIMVFLLLLGPCLAMGITLPLLCQREERLNPGHFASSLGALYSVNTLGAAVGALSTDFLLVPLMGVHATVLAAGSLNITVALLAYLTSGGGAKPLKALETPAAPEIPARVCLLLLGLSGCLGLALEILWIRVLAFINGCDVYAFSETLFVYLLGIVLGSFAAARVRAKLLQPIVLLFVLLSLTSALSLWTGVSHFQRHLPAIFPFEGMRLWGATCILLPSTLCLGALFPLLNAALRQNRQDAAGAVGQGYFCNTVGSLLGSLSTGFLLIPSLGMQRSLFLVATVSALVGFLLARRGLLKICALLLLLANGAALLVLPPEAAVMRLLGEKPENVLFLTEDHYGTVGLIRQWEDYEKDFYDNLIIDGYNMAGNSRTAKRYTAMLAMAPMLCHPHPQDVLVVAFGLCNTLTNVINQPESLRVDCVELAPRVVEATSHLEYAQRTLQSPKLNLIFGDGRNHLASTQRLYDVITAEPPPPTHAGIVNLYSREYYELCRSRLKPKGIVAQWLPVYEMSKFESQTIIRAFVEVFPSSYLWAGADAQLILVGSMEPLQVDYPEVKRRFAASQGKFAEAGWDDPAVFLASCLRGPSDLRKYVENIPPLTDDRPYIQYYHRDAHDYDMGFFDASFFSPELPVNGADSPGDRQQIEKAAFILKELSLYQYAGSPDHLLEQMVSARLRWDVLDAYPTSQYFPTVTQSSDRHLKAYLESGQHWEAARILAGQKHFEEALAECSKINPDDSSRKALEALILGRAGRLEEARKLAAQAADISPAASGYLTNSLTPKGSP